MIDRCLRTIVTCHSEFHRYLNVWNAHRDIEGDEENTEFIQLKFCNFVTHFMLFSENFFQASFIFNHVALKVVWYSLPSTQITSNIMGVDFYIGLCIGVCRCDLHKQQRSGFWSMRKGRFIFNKEMCLRFHILHIDNVIFFCIEHFKSSVNMILKTDNDRQLMQIIMSKCVTLKL